MFKKRFVAVGILASALASSFILPQVVHAQEVIDLDDDAPKEKKPKKKKAKGGADIDLDAEDGGAPVSAGQMTQECAAAKQAFDKERFAEAAEGFQRVMAGETGDDAGNKQLAEYYLAVSLYRMKFYQASYALFSVIADKPSHIKFKETLLWLAKLATQLPEPADIIERVGKYSDGDLARFDNDKQRELYWQLNYMLGRFKYRNRQYDEAVQLFQRVNSKSDYYVKSQFFMGISYVQERKAVPAVKAFQAIEKAVEEGAKGIDDEDRVRDLAYLSMARTYYSSSIQLDAETNAPNVNATKLSAAVKNWNLVNETSEYWLDALFEESWAYYMAGLFPQALGNIHTLESPYFPSSFYPEAAVLKAVIYFSNCNYEAATTVVARFNKKYKPMQEQLEKIMKRYKGENQEEAFFKFLKDVRDGKGDLDDGIRPIVANALSDRQLLRNIEYVQLLDEEDKRFKKAPPSFQSSGAGRHVDESIKLARELAVREAGKLAMSRYHRYVEDLKERLRDGEKILIDITAAHRNLLDEKIAKDQVSKAEAKIFGMVNPDEEHVFWPFNGEYWRDELGYYRQVVESKCGR